MFLGQKGGYKSMTHPSINPGSFTHHHSNHNPAIHSSSSYQNLNSEERKRSPDPLKEKKCEATRMQQLGD